MNFTGLILVLMSYQRTCSAVLTNKDIVLKLVDTQDPNISYNENVEQMLDKKLSYDFLDKLEFDNIPPESYMVVKAYICKINENYETVKNLAVPLFRAACERAKHFGQLANNKLDVGIRIFQWLTGDMDLICLFTIRDTVIHLPTTGYIIKTPYRVLWSDVFLSYSIPYGDENTAATTISSIKSWSHFAYSMTAFEKIPEPGYYAGFYGLCSLGPANSVKQENYNTKIEEAMATISSTIVKSRKLTSGSYTFRMTTSADYDCSCNFPSWCEGNLIIAYMVIRGD